MLNPDFLSNLIGIISIIIFLFIMGFFVKIAVKRVIQWNRNNNSPVITVKAKIIGKRIKVSGNNIFIHHSSPITIYYVAFEVQNGDRIEYKVKGTTYGMLAVNDAGELTYQGTRYKGFKRIR